eukprot:TRINITY_DN60168_c0_g1_i1.p1 TRINITY_DN60168_c0_g1~~TRINITY_DN60168_c0_g1_i1.p1  ORF type:complete len:509 (-),score=81.91 TRINITY_DN60168_c0_g1_i1:347-1873(-)
MTGRLHVQCINANGLLAADAAEGLFQGASSDPYVVFALRYEKNKRLYSWLSQTKVVEQSLDPEWNEEFVFELTNRRWGRPLELHMEVFDADPGAKSQLLGQANIPITRDFLQSATETWVDRQLSLQGDFKRSCPTAQGTINLRISWHPGSERCQPFWRSPNTVHLIGALHIGTGGLFLLVATRARWLCQGHTLPGCVDIEVPGAGLCALAACAGAMTAAGIHLAGVSGFLGEEWHTRYPRISHALQHELAFERAQESKAPSALEVHMNGSPMTGELKLGLSLNLCSAVSVNTMRMAAWISQLVALLMSSVGIALTRLEDGEDMMIAEGVYLSVLAQACIVGGALVLFYQHNMLRSVRHRPSVKQIREAMVSKSMLPSALRDLRGHTDGADLASHFQELKSRAGGNFKDFAGELKHLAQPLISKGHELEQQAASAIANISTVAHGANTQPFSNFGQPVAPGPEGDAAPGQSNGAGSADRRGDRRGRSRSGAESPPQDLPGNLSCGVFNC